jgi:hypothetical protein
VTLAELVMLQVSQSDSGGMHLPSASAAPRKDEFPRSRE